MTYAGRSSVPRGIVKTRSRRDTQGSLSHGGPRGLGEADAGVVSTRIGRCIPAHYVHVGHDCQPDFDQVGVPDKFSPWQEKSEKL